MAFDPKNGRARINMYGAPLQHWNRFDMCTLVSVFGYPLHVAPYFVNGNYEYLTMFVACKKPEKIPFHLKLRVNPHKKKIRVEITGWLDNQAPPPPPPHRGGGQEDERNRGRDEQGESQYRGRRNQYRDPPEERRNRGGDGNRGSRYRRDPSSSGSNWNRTASPWVENLRKKLMEEGILNNNGAIITPHQKSIAQEGHVSVNPDNGTVTRKDKGKQGQVRKIYSEEESMEAKMQLIQRTGYNSLFLISEILSVMNGGVNGIEGDNLAMLMGVVQGKKNSEKVGANGGVIIEELEDEATTEAEAMLSQEQETQMKEMLVKNKENMIPEDDGLLSGPPPGFEHVIPQTGSIPEPEQTNLGLQVVGPSNVKRSARIKAKKVEVKYNAGKREYKRKNNKPKKAKLEYLQSLSPLSIEQAQLVIQLAGVEIQGRLEDEVAKVVTT